MRSVLTLAVLILALVFPLRAHAAEDANAALGEEIARLVDSLDFSGWAETPGGASPQQLVERFSSGDFSLEPQEMIEGLFAFLLEDVRALLPTMAQVLLVSTLCGVVLKLREATGAEGVARASEWACYLIAAIPLVHCFAGMLAIARGAIDAMAAFARVLFPVLLTFLAALGANAASGVFQPAVMAASTALASGISGWLLPVMAITAALTVLARLSEQIKLDNLCKLLLTTSAWCLGIAFTAFLGVLSVQGAAASVFDGITLRTAKFAIDRFVPIVGGMLAETADTLLSCSLIVKNAVGAAGLLTLATLCLRPCLTLLAAVLAHKLCAALLEPVADGRVVRALNDLSGVLTLLFVSVLSVGAMFFVLVTALMNAGAATMMIR